MSALDLPVPTFETLDEALAYGQRFYDPQQFIDEFIARLKGHARLSAAPRYDALLVASGSAVIAARREAIKIGRAALLRDTELFKTIFHEELHLRLMQRARPGNMHALELVTHPDIFAAEEYVELVAARYLRQYELKFGRFKH